jgi:hypothetical protein
MTTQILFPPEFDQLSEDDKKSVTDLMKSILQAENATQILLDLFNSEKLDLEEFQEKYQEYLQEKADFEIITSPRNVEAIKAPKIASKPQSSSITIVKTFAEILVDKFSFFKTSAETICNEICIKSPSSKECSDCLNKIK